MKRGIAIKVRFAGPTNNRGSRWIATADHPIGRVTVGYNHDLDTGLENAKTAAQALVERWNADHVERYGVPDARTIVAGGHLPDGAYAFIVSH